MPTPSLTPDEAVATLRRSSLPTVLTEGLEDYLLFRRIEGRFKDIGLSLLPLGGKQSVLEVYRRRAEFAHLRAAFIVDRDLWLFEGVPPEFVNAEFILTDGYSIENDLYRDGHLEDLLTPDERTRFLADCDVICRWFSHMVRRHLDNNPYRMAFHPKHLLVGPATLSPDVMTACGYAGECNVLYPQIRADYVRLLRGKTLLELLVAHLSYQGRAAQHNARALIEMVALNPGACIQALTTRLDAIFR